jgi:S1-C subfamily serine protease
MSGEVVGINAMFLECGENLNFAIPINYARQLLAKSSTKLSALPNESESHQVEKRNDSRPLQASRPPSLQEQQMCAVAAKKSFDEENVVLGVTSRWYSSHFDTKSEVCLIMSFTAFDNPVVRNQLVISVDNAVEQRNYANFHGKLQEDGPYKPIASYACAVRPFGRDTIWCASETEFQSLVDKYFNIAW